MNSIKKKNGEKSLDHLSEITYWHLSQYVTYGKFIWEVQNLRVVSRLLYSLKLDRQLSLVDLAGWVNQGALPLLRFFVSEILHNFQIILSSKSLFSK